ncbi:MAG: FAD-dependent oxidoreductase [Proteobacteria bacterium]|nr:FAD-dependent oxidoreductase [Pseudomonadota bacterium]
MTTLHVVGAGLAGLAAALHAGRAGLSVRLYEAGTRAGGRCRTYHDPVLDRSIDNGAHLVLGANRAALAYLDRLGASGQMLEVAPARFPMLDLATGALWNLRPNAGPLPWWLLSRERRTPDCSPWQHLAGAKLLWASPEATVGQVLGGDHPTFERLWQPFCAAVLNTDPKEASARLMGRTLLRTFLAGERASRPHIARSGIGAAFVDPAVAALAEAGSPVEFASRLKAIESGDGRARALVFEGRRIELAPGDGVVLAVPPAMAASLVPGLTLVPNESRAIVNAHFRLERPAVLPGGLPFLGLVGGSAQWLFQRGDVVSVTVSAADDLVQESAETSAEHLWSDVARALGIVHAPPPASRIIKERRATFAQTPEQLRRRPGPVTGLRNVMLAGDWTDTGLPATIDGAIRSGETAASVWLAHRP